jgi:hypothetical protein
MKVRISYTVEVDDHFRRALAYHHGGSGMATREDVRRHFELHGSSEDDNLMWDYDQAVERGEVE